MAKKTARPTAAERKIVDRRLQKKYGHKYKVSEDWVPKLKKKVKATLRKEKQTIRQEEIKATKLSQRSRKQLAGLSEADYQGVMKILKRKK